MRHPSHDHDPRRAVPRGWLTFGLVVAALALVGCRTRHTVDVEPTHHTVKIEPIYMTVDINLRVQEELDRFYRGVVDGERASAEQGQGGEL